MAARRKKKSSLKVTIKYEIYGILIIIFAWISMAGKGALPGLGSVGRSLAHISMLVAGKLHYVIPFVFLYIGLYAMIKRAWPNKWSFRKTGVLLFVLGLLIHLHMGFFEQQYPEGGYSAWQIMNQPVGAFNDYVGDELTDTGYQQNLGGGLVGGFVYGLLFFLFDNLGAYFVKIGMFAIGFVCVTGWSYVEIVKKLRRSGSGFFERLRDRLEWSLTKLRRKQQSTRTNRRARLLKADEEDDDEVMLPEEETYTPKKAKKPTFFQLFKQPDDEKEPANEDEQYAANVPLPSDDEPLESPLITAPGGLSEEPVPVIHDFQSYDDGGPYAQQSQGPASEPIASVADPIASKPDTAGSADGAKIAKALPEPGEALEEIELNPEAKSDKPYVLPPFQLLQKPAGAGKGGSLDHMGNARKLEATLESFGVRAKVVGVVRGPTVTRYEIQPDIGVKVSRIVSLTDDIALALAAKDIRMEAPIPGKAAIGIEVPNSEVSLVTLREVMESAAFHESDAKLTVALGRDISGQPIVGNLAKMPHLLVAGATGSGKSVCINGIIVSVLYKAKPDEVKFLMIDPKMVELNVYNGIPHLLAPVVTDPRRASLALKKVVKEMETRYELFSKSGTRNIEGYNHLLVQEGQKPLPYIVVIVDELADLMMVAANDVEDAICRLAQMARAAGIHLIIATQRPSVDVITGVIKANIPSRIAFGVSSQVDSRTILDSVGAEKLLGRGDMLFVPVGANKPVRVQGAFLSDGEVESVVHYVRDQEKADYQPEMVPEVEESDSQTDEFVDELFDQAVQIILEAKQASVSLLQRRMRVGYTRAARLIDTMEAKGIVGPYEGSKPREVLVSLEEYQQRAVPS